MSDNPITNESKTEDEMAEEVIQEIQDQEKTAGPNF